MKYSVIPTDQFLEASNHEKPIASDFALQAQIAAFPAISTYRSDQNGKLSIANSVIRIAGFRTQRHFHNSWGLIQPPLKGIYNKSLFLRYAIFRTLVAQGTRLENR